MNEVLITQTWVCIIYFNSKTSSSSLVLYFWGVKIRKQLIIELQSVLCVGIIIKIAQCCWLYETEPHLCRRILPKIMTSTMVIIILFKRLLLDLELHSVQKSCNTVVIQKNRNTKELKSLLSFMVDLSGWRINSINLWPSDCVTETTQCISIFNS